MNTKKKKQWRPRLGGHGNTLVELGMKTKPWLTGTRNLPYATIPVTDHWEHWPVESRRFHLWLLARFHDEYRINVDFPTLHAAVGEIAAIAREKRTNHPVFVRAACVPDGLNPERDKLYLDLGNDKWQAVEITADRWRIIEAFDCPVRFRRPKDMLPLPMPIQGGNLDHLHKFVRVTDEDFPRLIRWLLDAFHTDRRTSVLSLHGPAGAGKTTAASLLRTLLDPNATPVQGLPETQWDVFQVAHNEWCMVIEYERRCPKWLSTAIDKLSNGAGRDMSVRRVILTNIQKSWAGGHSEKFHLPATGGSAQRLREHLDCEFHLAHPYLFGAILDALARKEYFNPVTESTTE